VGTDGSGSIGQWDSPGKERKRVPGKAKRYTPEFKKQAARIVIDNSLPIAQVARELDISDTTLKFWVQGYRKKLAGQPLLRNLPDQERIRELERRNRELEMENAFLKKGVPRAREAA
jgi:transposase-like protein